MNSRKMGNRKYVLNEHIFDIINTSAKAYWLGYLYCDGNVWVAKNDYRVNLTSKDLDVIQKFQKFLETDRPFRKIVNKLNKKSYISFRQDVQSKHLVQILTSYGMIPNKTYDHSVPIYIPPGKLERHFWRGCIDADGSINFTYTYYTQRNGRRAGPYLEVNLGLYNYNDNLLKDCQMFFKVGRLDSHTWACRKRPPAVLPFLTKLYGYSSPNTRLDRKYQKYLEIKHCV